MWVRLGLLTAAMFLAGTVLGALLASAVGLPQGLGGIAGAVLAYVASGRVLRRAAERARQEPDGGAA